MAGNFRAWFGLSLSIGCTSILLSACHLTADRAEPAITAIQQPSTTSKCRIVRHVFGETCVPLKPQRIVALDPSTTVDPLIALDIKPIGFGSSHNGKGEAVIYGISFDDIAGAKNIGNPEEPSLEKILLLKPDLILATEYNRYDRYKLLSAIAPTVVVPYINEDIIESKDYFQKNLRYVAKVVGKEAKAEAVLSQYQQRIEKLKKRLGKQFDRLEVSILYHTGGYIYGPMKDIDPNSSILTDLGLRQKLPHPGKYLNIETINEFDADILFIIDIDRRTLSFYRQNPIFSSLKAIKNHRAYTVTPEKWYALGISGANKILDDLEQYLVNDP
ncbi:MAG: iron-siderophore ABC transporter substrate-binding protein [Cyanosarcina radialis HA8281-LM2]|jgi:iron complex transport system substrate-binding protein|nr:iron-siderophore ABC transporter substrate-binding protein [Cyanosarcina radialis HA8281-LM2]